MAQATAPILDSTHPEMPERANYFRLLVRCGPKQTPRLTDCCPFDMLRSSFGW